MIFVKNPKEGIRRSASGAWPHWTIPLLLNADLQLLFRCNQVLHRRCSFRIPPSQAWRLACGCFFWNRRFISRTHFTVPTLCFYCYKDSSNNVFGVRDRTGRVRCRSLSLTHLLVICFFYSAGVRHGQRQSAAAILAFRRRKPDGLLVAVSSEIAYSIYAPTSPCLLNVYWVLML